MGSTPRLTGAARREQLLDVTKAIVVERGYHAVSIEAVCRAAGITRPVVYGHFGDLGGLLDALVTRESRRGMEAIAAFMPAVLGEGDPRERLLAALEAYLRTVQADPATWRLLLVGPEGTPERLRASVQRGRDAVVGVLADAVAPGLGGGEPPPDPGLLARWLQAVADESARLLLTRPADHSVARAVAAARWALERFS